jgi:small neutral amino acid transporter SnatA (MarC family)
MAGRSSGLRVTGALADATGRSDEEVRLALTVAVLVGALLAASRLVRLLGDLGADVLRQAGR